MLLRNGFLDVLRALAISMVLACHLANFFAPGTAVAVALGNGGRGVDLFFVLSGWLLGRQLFEEARATGTVDIKRFWYRRWLRTLPAYYAVLLGHVLLLSVRGKAELIDWRYFVFLQNYLPELPFFAVSWSLCVEEYFYLVIAPAIFLAIRSRWATIGFILVVVVLCGLHAVGIYGPQDVHGLTTATHVRFEQCLVGVLMAWVAVNRPTIWERAIPWAKSLAILGVLAFVVATVNRYSWVIPDLGTVSWALLFASWVFFGVVGPYQAPVTNPVVTFLAVRAYSIYLVHADAFNLIRTLSENFGPIPSVIQMVLGMMVCLVVAEGLYRVVERPFMRSREWFRASRSRHEQANTLLPGPDNAGTVAITVPEMTTGKALASPVIHPQ